MGESDNQQAGTALDTVAARPRTRRLPPWRILLHNANNDMSYVVETIVALTRLTRHDAEVRMLEAHNKGLSLLLTTRREHAELLDEQFQSKRLKVTIEPAD